MAETEDEEVAGGGAATSTAATVFSSSADMRLVEEALRASERSLHLITN